MKKIILLTTSLLFAIAIRGQQQLSYAYDAAGNRTSRTIVLATRSANATINKPDSVFFEEKLADKQLKIYPNPVQSQLTIEVEGFEPGMQGEFSLFNITGGMLIRRRITGSNTYLDMSRYTKGTYILNIQLRGQTTSWKVIKQ